MPISVDDVPNASSKGRLALSLGLIATIVLVLAACWLHESASDVVLSPKTEVLPSSKISSGASEVTTNDVTIADVEVAGKSYTFRSNGIGLYPRISIPGRSTVKIRLHVHPGEPIEEQVLDGGTFGGETSYQQQTGNSSGMIALNYHPTASPGSSRMAIYRGGSREIFDFWVDPTLSEEKNP